MTDQPSSTQHRTASIERSTSESSISVWLDLDGTGESEIDTGVGFYDHMLTALSRHSGMDMKVKATGDLHIDGHHTIEDTAIALGQALKIALGDKSGITRYGDATIPLDEALAHCTVDVAGRPYVVHTGEPDAQVYALIGGSGVPYAGSMTRHVVEAQFKALARALRTALAPDPRTLGVPSTKGTLNA